MLLQKKRAQGQEKSKEIVQTAVNAIKAIDNKAVAGESIASKAKTSSLSLTPVHSLYRLEVLGESSP
jgi:hypothetical protein